MCKFHDPSIIGPEIQRGGPRSHKLQPSCYMNKLRWFGVELFETSYIECKTASE